MKTTEAELRQSLERFIEAAIDLLDTLDGDPDEEQEMGLDQDAVPITLNCSRKPDKVLRLSGMDE
jgi:hypothetical protein